MPDSFSANFDLIKKFPDYSVKEPVFRAKEAGTRVEIPPVMLSRTTDVYALLMGKYGTFTGDKSSKSSSIRFQKAIQHFL